ncbi:ECF transporter S component [Saccharothrix saharensis]|uniref:ECF transporter S component n=1 Tax=Saccharothrix saharensis TaxID=571190 RepID=UPI0036C654A9
MNRSIRVRPRATLALAVAAAISVVAFGWPLLVSADAAIAQGATGPWTFALVLPLVLAVVLAELSEGGLDAKAVAMLGVLSALGAAIRPLGAGTAGIETVFFLLVLGGRVFGPGFGFVLGNTMLFASALLTGGVGPWLPYQMLGAAWVALGAGLLPSWRGKAELALLAAYSAAASLVYGLLLNLSFWPFALSTGSTSLSFQPGAPILDNLVRVVAFSLATSLGWDIGRAVTTTILVLATGPVLLRTLRRAARRASFGEPVFDGPVFDDPVITGAAAPPPPPTRPAPPA